MEAVAKRWQIAAKITPEADQNLENYPPILRQLLFNRGIATHDEAEDFLKAELPKTDVYELTGIQAAVTRIDSAISQGEKVAVFGDYDSDGVTASVLMIETLTALGIDCQVYIPDRFAEGYGLNKAALSKLKDDGFALAITVDCGIRAVPEAIHAQEIGLDLIITDHHTPGPELPPAVAVINARQDGDIYPDKNLAGVGTAYKLAFALLEKHQPETLRHEHLLDLVAIGTVADLVPLIGENRALVKQGLRFLRRPHRQGIQSLLGVADVKPSQVMSSHIGFTLGPRINAAGRLASAMDAFNLLMAPDVWSAGKQAQHLDNINRERQKITRDIQAIAEEMVVKSDPDAFLIFAADPAFNMGVVGLSASRLVDEYYRPAVVAHIGEEFTRGSCRSIAEFHITNALDECGDLLEHWGGHAAAAGFTVRNENAAEFEARLKQLATDQLKDEDLQPLINADAEVQLKDLNTELLQSLEQLQPTGYGNPEAVFVTRNLSVKANRAVGSEKTHLKLTVSDGFLFMDAIAFRLGHWAGELPEKIDVIYNFEINEFNGRKNFQLNVRDIKPSAKLL